MPLITTTGGGSVRGFGRGRGEGDIVLPPSLVALGTEVFYSLDTQVTLSTPGVYYTILGSGSSISFNVYGASGGNGGATPGSGGIVSGQCNLSSIPDGYLVFVVGGRGGQGGESAGTVSVVAGIAYLIPGGFNGGGIGVDNNSVRTRAGGGGGASDIRLSFGTSETDYNGGTRILVAGGGGGSTNNPSASGGNGGWPNGSNAATGNFVPGFGGTQTAGGSLNGGFGLGGSNLTNTGWNGGGGGGWYGGGAPEQHIGAGGGSSYYDPNRILNFTHGTSSTTNGLIEFTFS